VPRGCASFLFGRGGRVTKRSARRLVAVCGLRLAVFLGVLSAGAQVISHHYGLRDHILDSSSDNSVGGALTALLLASTVVVAWLVALVRRSTQTVLLAACISIVFAFELTDPPHRVAISAPFGLLAVALLWRLASSDRLAGPLLRAGCVVLGMAFVGHSFGSWLVNRFDLGPDSWLYQLKAIVKHSGELAAWALIAFGLWVLRLDQPLKRRGRREAQRPRKTIDEAPFGHRLS